MSNALAIASVTAVLKDLLNNGVIDHDLTAAVGEVVVSALAPDRIDLTPGTGKSQLNLFLYQVSPNPGWRNVGLPSRNAAGDRISNPPLALDLHYLLTAYGMEEFHAEILLGYGMQWLHETPILTREAIRTALASPSPVTGAGLLPASLQALAASALAEQVEQIKITPQTLSTEELSKLWTAFQAKYRPTAAYQVSVVLIESHRPTRPALPVRARQLYTVPFRCPVIEEIQSQEDRDAPVLSHQAIQAGHRLVLVGRQLRGEETSVRIGGIEVTPARGEITDTRLTVAIPAGLPAGVQSVQVIHRLRMGDPPVSHRGVESGLAAFVLRPRIESLEVTEVTGSGSELRSARVHLTVVPEPGPTQRVSLLLNQLAAAGASPPGEPPAPSAYQFVGPSPTPASPPVPGATLSIPIAGVRAGTYLVRVQVDGAESLLGTDAAGRYNSPLLVVP